MIFFQNYYLRTFDFFDSFPKFLGGGPPPPQFVSMGM